MRLNLRCSILLPVAGALAVFTGVFLFTGCRSPRTGAQLQRFEFKQPHMGTLFTITLYAPDEVKARNAAELAFEKVAALERMMTDYDPESELMQLRQKPVGRPIHVSEELFAVLQKSQRLARLSDGAFDITVGPVVRLWRRARRTETMPSPEMLARARATVGYQMLKLDEREQTITFTAPGIQLDLGGIGKGYAADQALGVLRQQGIKRALVAASGDIAAGEPPPGQSGWRVGIGAMDKGPELARNEVCGTARVAPAVMRRRSWRLRESVIRTSWTRERGWV